MILKIVFFCAVTFAGMFLPVWIHSLLFRKKIVAKREAERLEAERLEAERLEAERLEAERRTASLRRMAISATLYRVSIPKTKRKIEALLKKTPENGASEEEYFSAMNKAIIILNKSIKNQ